MTTVQRRRRRRRRRGRRLTGRGSRWTRGRRWEDAESEEATLSLMPD
jgi:hypothetical protein